MEALLATEALIIVALVLLNGILAGSEIAVVALRKTRVEQLVATGSRAARAIRKLQGDPERFMATVQIGITVVGATAGAFGGASFAKHLAPVLARVPWLQAYADQVALALVVGAISFLSLVLGELVPKSLALRSAEAYALIIARPMVWLSRAARPLVWFLTASSNLVLRIFGDRTNFTETRHSPEELQQIVDEAASAGTVDRTAGDIAARAMDFPDLTARHVMVPRARVVGLMRDASREELRRVVLEEGHTRMPVLEAVDRVVGYVTVRDLFAVLLEGELIVLEDAIRPAYEVPDSARVVDILTGMRKRRTELAIVTDGGGSMLGIVTMENVVEELVGQITSEHDQDQGHPLTRERNGDVVVRGDMPVHELNRRLGWQLPEGETWATVAGLVLELAKRIPSAGDRFETQDGASIEILAASEREVLEVRLRPRPTRDVDTDAH
ncbi:MAG: hemolysin family protein [Polyangiaceae bacterium]